jgi:8-oxo-dGTP pyrophosphatase MutT (NUDIX family)
MTDASAAPKPAATVVLARDRAEGGIEIFLVQRHGGMGFMGGMHVFPGGTLSVGDTSDAMRARIEEPAETRVVHPWGEGVGRERAIALAVAAIRETFEEAGVLLCHAVDAGALRSMRTRLLAGDAFATLLEEAGLRLRLDVLTPLSRWITPKLEPKRYDTLFFLARAPGAQHAEHDRHETIAGAWLAPDDALAKASAGEIRLAPPTSRTIEGLRNASSIDVAVERALARTPPRVEPVLRVHGDEVWILYPGDPDHPDRDVVFEGPTRIVLRRGDAKARTKSE